MLLSCCHTVAYHQVATEQRCTYIFCILAGTKVNDVLYLIKSNEIVLQKTSDANVTLTQL